jgi:hypothetical protein
MLASAYDANLASRQGRSLGGIEPGSRSQVGGKWECSTAVSHLTGRDELQRSQGNLEIGSVGLEIVESTSDLGLKLGRALPRRAVGRDLVQ